MLDFVNKGMYCEALEVLDIYEVYKDKNVKNN